jgi:hypothetical protein
MKRLILGGLSLALGCLVAHVHAEELQWRPAPTRSTAQTSGPAATVSQQPSFTLRQPQPVASAPEAPRELQLVPVAFTEFASDKTGQAQTSTDTKEGIKPLPIGPSLGGPALGKKPEMVPIPPPTSTLPGAAAPLAPVPYGSAIHYDSYPGTDKGPEVAPTPKALPTPETYSLPGTVPPHGAAFEGGPDWSCCGGDCCGGGDCCSEGCCRHGWCFGCCGQGCLPRFYVRAEYLLWSMKNPSIPALVTTTNLNNAQLLALGPLIRPGALPQAGTVVLLDQDNFHEPVFSGGRFTVGASGICGEWGAEATFLFLGQQAANFSAGPDPNLPLFRPFINAFTGGPDAQLVALGSLSGGITVHEATSLWGMEGNLRRNLLCDCNRKLDFLAGFRFLELHDELNIHESLMFTRTINFVNGTTANAGDRISVFDSFNTRNTFYGGQAGLDFESKHGRWIFGAWTKVALGNMHQVVNIDGSTVFTPAAGGTFAGKGGLFAQPTNINTYSRNRFAVVPEAGLKLGYQCTDHLSVFIAYNFLYMSTVVRPGNQIDTTVNPTQLPVNIPRLGGQAIQGVPLAAQGTLIGDARPAFIFHSVDHWAQGANVGLEWRY